MPLGPGKYGARAEVLLREVGARLVVVITVGVRPEDGAFDVASVDPSAVAELPAILRRIANGIEQDLRTTSN